MASRQMATVSNGSPVIRPSIQANNHRRSLGLGAGASTGLIFAREREDRLLPLPFRAVGGEPRGGHRLGATGSRRAQAHDQGP